MGDPKRLLPFVLALLLTACGAAGSPADQTRSSGEALDSEVLDLLAQDGFGPLRLGLTGEEVTALLGPPGEKGEPWLRGADGLYHAEWRYPERGIALDLSSGTESGPYEVAGITISAPSRLRSWRGVAVGDTAEYVRKNYKGFIDPDAPARDDRIVAGSAYGGLVFTLTDGEVSRMFLGAAAE